MKKMLALLLLAMLGGKAMIADEGMWLLNLLQRINEAEMRNMGLNLTAEEIYNINNASLKDAIVRLNGGSCTAEVISGKGLVLTNHHCAYGAIQSLATVENDILTNGFWAKSHDQERPMDGFFVSFLERIDDKTEEVLSQLKGEMTEQERADKITEISRKMEKEAAEAMDGKGYSAQLKSFFYGNEFYMMTYRDYTDVRLVGNPNESIGKYGGDTDNWMWPRHTGDFSMIRIYSDKDNNPADYSEDNVPFTPKRHLKVSLDGVEDGDFAMIMGYPGSTDRFLSSWGVQQALDIHNPTVVDIRDLKLKTMKKHMDADKAVRLKYASKYASTANYWKYYIGQSKGLKRLDVYGQKQEIEKKFADWVAANPAREKEYGEALAMIESYYDATNASDKADTYSLEAGLIGADITLFAFRMGRIMNIYFDADAETEEGKTRREQMLGAAKANAADFFKDYDKATDMDVFVQLGQKYYDEIKGDKAPTIFATIRDKYKGSLARYASKMYPKSFVTDQARLEAFLASPNEKKWKKDLAVNYAASIFEVYQSRGGESTDQFDTGYRLFVKGLREMNKGTNYAPDANSTMRLSYGTVGDYYPADAIHYDYVTTANGILQKEDPKNPEFVVPAELKKLIQAEDYGRWADDSGELVVCFLTNNDITGGNSGSPVMNADGNLIGLAFDGNWEAMSGDIAFEPELQRTISVDIRYVMFIVDKMAGAQNIIDEIDFVKTKPKMDAKPVNEAAAAATEAVSK